ncbi:beta-aspartyl-peptidase (threonine type) [Luteibacter sp. Sphag1AF]|uniref:isoaspartyl peptidase/L-asparaginase family protein n=1 Tax=Luteibacter sp. Sphag1AF TaxID=2587031 RepID=UPI00161974DA|nr:isoaspartyl peptidase/L-asparaginase [Luteibacter sp. Sphag1AF]MBB3225453.1 beta-aspartyl-peptidase (threonine type) [Luteibacter sp. Sphag1AF]
MKRHISFALAIASMAVAGWVSAATPVLVIHGGAGVIKRDMSPARDKAVRAALTQALTAGYAELKSGKAAVDAVSAAIVVLENDPNFNAGKGAVFTHEGKNELDAAIMDGSTLKAGAIAGVQRVRNPILLARSVMDHSPHVMLAGAGAEAFAKENGVELVDPSYFRTEERWQQLQKALKEDAQKVPHADEETAKHFGTVGAVALDAAGHLAAGTSTGGMTDKRWGRIGDSPLIGAGTYANDGCAMSGTGWGEFYIRTVAAHEVCMRVTQMRVPLSRAAAEVINQEIPSLGGNGGAIALDRDGHIAMPFNTDGMFRGWIGADGVPHVAIYGDEDDGLSEAE